MLRKSQRDSTNTRRPPQPQRFPFRLKRRPEERIILLGQEMDLVKPQEVLHFISTCVERGQQAVVANHNAHSLHLLKARPELQAFYEQADLVEIDSTPLLIWAQISGRRKSRRFHRCTYLDWRDDFWTMAASGSWRVFYLGAAPGVAQKAADRLLSEFPKVRLQVRDGYFDASRGSRENQAVLSDILHFRPDVLLVGMGMPRQEEWIAANRAALPDCVILPVGAAFDYEAGVQAAAPRWLGRVGMEWLYRLARDPRRLFRRYCIEPWTLLTLLAADLRAARQEKSETRHQERRSQSGPSVASPKRRASDRRGSISASAYPAVLLDRPVSDEGPRP